MDPPVASPRGMSGVGDGTGTFDELGRRVRTSYRVVVRIQVDVVLVTNSRPVLVSVGKIRTAGQLVQVQRQHRQEALQVGLLVDGVVQVAGLLPR